MSDDPRAEARAERARRYAQLMACPACGHEVSPWADACPGCGRPPTYEDRRAFHVETARARRIVLPSATLWVLAFAVLGGVAWGLVALLADTEESVVSVQAAAEQREERFAANAELARSRGVPGRVRANDTRVLYEPGGAKHLVVHAGEPVRIVDERDEWLQVLLPERRSWNEVVERGWVEASRIERLPTEEKPG